MSTMYFYDKPTRPDLDQLLIDITASEMTDKVIDYPRWDEENTDKELCVFWSSELSGADKILLDEIVSGI